MTSPLLVLAVAAAGGVGSGLRHLADQAVPARLRDRFPWGIVAVNISGSFALGLLVGAFAGTTAEAVLGVGLLGGYTTFSTACLDAVSMLAQRRRVLAAGYGAGTLLAGVLAAACGVAIAS